MLNYEEVKNFPFPARSATYTARDAMLYALGLGFGSDPLDERQLRYVTEEDQAVVPTMPVVFCHPGMWVNEPKLGLDWRKLVHASQRLVLHRPLVPEATVRGNIRNVTVADRGEGRGAIVVHRREILDDAGSNVIATSDATYLFRGDGGFSAGGGASDALPPRSEGSVPDRAPDRVLDLATRQDAALLYRLSGDYNPIHSSPAVAKAAGFPRPILQGLCTFGIAARGILEAWCDYRADALKELSVRFTAPVFPGETIRLEMWEENGSVVFRASVRERDVVVLQDGSAILAARGAA